MSRFTVDNNKLVYRFDAEKLWIEPWGKDALRVRATKCAEMPLKDWSLLPQEEVKAEITLNDDGSAEIKNGKITFYNDKGQLLLDEYVRNRQDI